MNMTVNHAGEIIKETGDRTYDKMIGWRSFQTKMPKQVDSLYTKAGVHFEMSLNETEFNEIHTNEVKKYCQQAETSWNAYYSKDTNKTSINIKQELVNGKTGIGLMIN